MISVIHKYISVQIRLWNACKYKYRMLYYYPRMIRVIISFLLLPFGFQFHIFFFFFKMGLFFGSSQALNSDWNLCKSMQFAKNWQRNTVNEFCTLKECCTFGSIGKILSPDLTSAVIRFPIFDEARVVVKLAGVDSTSFLERHEFSGVFVFFSLASLGGTWIEWIVYRHLTPPIVSLDTCCCRIKILSINLLNWNSPEILLWEPGQISINYLHILWYLQWTCYYLEF